MDRRQFVAGLAAALPLGGAGLARDPSGRRKDARSGAGFSDRARRGAPASAPHVRPGRADRPVCIFSKHLQFLDYDGAAETAAAMGFDGVDLTVRPGGHVHPQNVERDLPRAVEAFRRAGLETPMMATAVTAVDDPHAETVLRTAADLGIRYYRMGYLHYDESAPLPETLDAYRARFERLADLNERLGLQGAYQNHDGDMVGSPVWDLHRLVDGLDPAAVGVQYDVRHATVEGAHAWPLGMRLLAPYIRTTVIKDFAWEERNGRWLVRNVPLGEGAVDFGAYFDLVRDLDVAGPISLHVEYELPEHDDLERRTRETAAHIARDLDRLRRYLAEAGLGPG